MEFNSIIIYIACIVSLFLIGKFFILPLKTILKILGNSILGGLIIFIINIIGNLFNFHIGLNFGTALIIGFLGVPRSYPFNYFKNVDLTVGSIINVGVNKNTSAFFCKNNALI